MTRILNDKSVRELITVSRDIGQLSAISNLLVKKNFPEEALVPVAKEINQYVLALRETLHNFVDGLDLSLVDDDGLDYDEKVIGDALQSGDFSKSSDSDDDDYITIDDDETETDDDAVLDFEDDSETKAVLTKDVIDEEAIAEDVTSELDDGIDVESTTSESLDLDFDALEKSVDLSVDDILVKTTSISDSTKTDRPRIDEALLTSELGDND